MDDLHRSTLVEKHFSFLALGDILNSYIVTKHKEQKESLVGCKQDSLSLFCFLFFVAHNNVTVGQVSNEPLTGGRCLAACQQFAVDAEILKVAKIAQLEHKKPP